MTSGVVGQKSICHNFVTLHALLSLTYYVTNVPLIRAFNRAMLPTLSRTWKTENHTYVVIGIAAFGKESVGIGNGIWAIEWSHDR